MVIKLCGCTAAVHQMQTVVPGIAVLTSERSSDAVTSATSAVLCPAQDVPHTTDIETTIDLVGGINSPLVLHTSDSDGRRQRIVAKSGQDDLRQDAVMQQFFGLINALLASSAASRQRRLSIRTYRYHDAPPLVALLSSFDQWASCSVLS